MVDFYWHGGIHEKINYVTPKEFYPEENSSRKNELIEKFVMYFFFEIQSNYSKTLGWIEYTRVLVAPY